MIIVVDDDAVRRSLRFMLELEGLGVRDYASGEALLSEPQLPDRGCLLVDQDIPAISGVDLVARLKQRAVRLPAILIAGRLTNEIRSAAAQAGFLAVFEKPLQDGGFVEAIHLALACG
ncbi:response regulator transcription factor [Chelatococcus sambhunathii]|uniref:response regulator transcription factor n=1 Tax=Chelatococcus sambhunathii TaxID=363953 RepID=UPI002852B391|nr:response regulator [Chelatococcus sambhunathii]